MRQEIINILKFEELNDGAKEKARDWYRGTMDLDYEHENDYLVEYFAEQLEELGYSVPDKSNKGWWVTWDQYQNVNLRTVYTDELGKIAERVLDAKKYRRFMRIIGAADINTHGSGKDITIELSSYYDDDYPKTSGILQDLENTIIKELQSMEWKFQKQIRESHEYLESNEHIDDMISANEYEFTEEGERW